MNFPFHIRFEIEVVNPVTLFEIMEKGEQVGLKVTTTHLPDTDWNPHYKYHVFLLIEGHDKIGIAAFVQMIDRENLLSVGKKTRGNMWKEINEGVSKAAEDISWL